MLDPYRVLELSSSRTAHCGQLFAHLGADVIAIEPPAGSDARLHGPFCEDMPHPERSLTWWAFNTNKRGIVLDLETADGQAEFLRLVETADFLIEGFTPGYLDGLGLDYDRLAAINPRLVVASITPFGQTGPKAHHAASDLTLVAAASVLSLFGDPDRAPTRTSAPLAYHYAGGEAMIGCLVAHLERARSGRGQWVDVSAQAALTNAGQSFTLTGAWGETNIHRAGGRTNTPKGWFPTQKVYRCKDGHVCMPKLSEDLLALICQAGFCNPSLERLDVRAYMAIIASGRPPAELAQVQAAFERFCLAHTKAELHALAQERRLYISPIFTMEDVVKSPQLSSRGYWAEVEHPELERCFLYPAAFAQFSESSVQVRRRAPLLGEHTAELLGGEAGSVTGRFGRGGNLGGATPQQNAVKRHPAAPAIHESNGYAALQGINVIDMTRVMAGPNAVRYLSDFGATVVRVEAPTHLNDNHDSLLYNNNNAGKYSLSLNLRTLEGRRLFLRLVRWADVVVENFTPRVMDSLGLGYESLRAEKPDIILVSTCIHGHSGPWSATRGFGDYGGAVAGFTELVGWPDRAPVYPAGPSDYIAPKFTAASILAALDYRRRTGKGQFVDVSQVESSLVYLAPTVLEYTANGRIAGRDGNRDGSAAPHGVFACTGEDRWVAIAVESEAQWQALCHAAGLEDWLEDARFCTFVARKRNEDELERQISTWTSGRTREAVERILQAAGVPASAVFDVVEAVGEPQLRAWGHFKEVEHAKLGTVTVESCRMKLSRTPPHIRAAGPTLGQHNQFVLGGLLGLCDEEIADAAVAGALG